MPEPLKPPLRPNVIVLPLTVSWSPDWNAVWSTEVPMAGVPPSSVAPLSVAVLGVLLRTVVPGLRPSSVSGEPVPSTMTRSVVRPVLMLSAPVVASIEDALAPLAPVMVSIAVSRALTFWSKPMVQLPLPSALAAPLVTNAIVLPLTVKLSPFCGAAALPAPSVKAESSVVPAAAALEAPVLSAVPILVLLA
ncbi:hypothetical protein ACVJGD_002662 [Bradyrhizobium sp. USDA 10063]